MHEAVAAVRVQLAGPDHHLAVPHHRQRHKAGRVQLAVQGSLLPAEQTQVRKSCGLLKCVLTAIHSTVNEIVETYAISSLIESIFIKKFYKVFSEVVNFVFETHKTINKQYFTTTLLIEKVIYF